MFATRSWQEFLRYRSVSKMWLHVPILEFMRPRLDKLTDHGCVNLSNIDTSLQYLHLKGCYLTDAGLRDLAKLPSLLTFIFRGLDTVAVTSNGLQALGKLKKLKALFLENVCLKEHHGLSLQFVAELESLRKFMIFKSRIMDVGFQGLRREGKINIKTFVLWECADYVTTPALLHLVRRLNKLELFSAKFSEHDICISTILRALPDPHSVKIFIVPRSVFECSTRHK